jgi:hypothetical protein
MSQLFNQSKVNIDWEEVNLEELLPAPDELDFETPLSPTQLFLQKYPDKGIFYILHLNRSFSEVLLKRLARIEGVERLIPLSRYRAIFNFGQLFKDASNDRDHFHLVKRDVLKCIDKFFYPEKYQEVTENVET